MEVKIGITRIPHEIVIEINESADEVADSFRAAFVAGTPWELTDAKGRRVIIPPAQVGFIDLGATTSRPVGFGTL